MAFLTETLIQQGIPKEMIILILMLPIIATIIAFSRQVIGIRAFGLYTPLILTFSFVGTGIKFGLMVFATVITVSTIIRFLSKKFRLLYLPRIGFIITITSLIILLLFYLEIFNLKNTYLYSLISVILIIILLEKFLAAQIERGFKIALTLTIETLLLAVVGYFIISWPSLQKFVINFPLIVLGAAIVINIFLGKWTGLRIYEYFRFREALRHIEPKTKKRVNYKL